MHRTELANIRVLFMVTLPLVAHVTINKDIYLKNILTLIFIGVYMFSVGGTAIKKHRIW
jgi:hypothetical protein